MHCIGSTGCMEDLRADCQLTATEIRGRHQRVGTSAGSLGLLDVPKLLPQSSLLGIYFHSWHQNKINRRYTKREKRGNSKHRCNILHVDPDFTSGLQRSPGEGNCYPLQYSCLQNRMDREVWWANKSMGSQRLRHDWMTNTLFIFLMKKLKKNFT